MRHLRPTSCVLVSGGLDSAVLLTRLLQNGERVLPLYLRHGLRWEAAERYWLRRLLRALRSPALCPLAVVEVPLRALYGAHWSLAGAGVPGARSADAAVYLPGRNLLLLSAAGVLCAQRGIRTIALGTLKGNPFGDATPPFFRQMASCFRQALGTPIRILTPLARLRKVELIRAARGVPWTLTFSCLDPQGRRHCGRCNKCAERQRAFRLAGLSDPTRYAGRRLPCA